jgi:hypothetical protein
MNLQNHKGRDLYWTKERVISALKEASREIRGPLPCLDAEYNRYKKGEYDWPCSIHVLKYFHSMARGWLAAGVDPSRVLIHNVDWNEEEDAYLLDNAGRKTLKQIAEYLRRSYGACKARLNKFHKVKAKENQGYLSAAALAREYGVPYHRVRQALVDGNIPAKYDRSRNQWQIDPMYIMLLDGAQGVLSRPKRTWKTTAPDIGDYYKRHGLKRTMIDGKLVRMPVIEGVANGRGRYG